jgi:membrane-bound lytic murein transglycosylase B
MKKMRMRFFIIFFATLFCTPAMAHSELANKPEVKHFIHYMVKEYHFNEAVLIATMDAVKIRKSAASKMSAPAEAKPWYTYRTFFVTESRIHQGVEFWLKYHDALTRAEKIYGVPASIIVATIGVETKYGKNTGNYRVIDALATFAFSHSSRAPYFRNELKELLLLARAQHIDPLKIKGSYAGAIGQPQFMPSSYRYYAVDFSGDGKIDLSHNEVDIIGSIANYYKKHGWLSDQPVAIPTALRNSSYFSHQALPALSQLDLVRLGITANEKLPLHQKVKLVELQDYFGKEYWLAFHNFDVIKRYNPSNLYAMAVYQLSHYIDNAKGDPA